ncbi:MAG: Lrp/AsnC family transcriptional regulator [Candidatus Nanoarchaeia archaeon]|jgi:DNA-binding Lrp family transcriptional regulator|nr:Lrp/AsnC family transcriptional regulator [Candidatus Nanoarchaeia archaeon]
MDVRLTPKDLEILKYLRNDARQTLTQLSRKTKIPVSTLFDRLRNYEKSMIIRHASLLNFSKLGYNARAQMFFKFSMMHKDVARSFFSNHPQINSVYLLSNDYDYSVDGIFENVCDVKNFVEDVEKRFSPTEQKVIFVAEELQKEGFLSK